MAKTTVSHPNTHSTQARTNMASKAIAKIIEASLDTRDSHRMISALLDGISDYCHSKDTQRTFAYMLEAYSRMYSLLPEIKANVRAAIRRIASQIPKNPAKSQELALELFKASCHLSEMQEQIQKQILNAIPEPQTSTQHKGDLP
jgi:aminopeptidase N